LYYGLKNGDWNATSSGETEKIDSSLTKNVFGLLLELGYAIPLSDTVSFDLLFKAKLSLGYAFEDDPEKLKSNSFLLGGALTFKL